MSTSTSSSSKPADRSQPTLLGLPAEVFERVAELAESSDLLSLRLTCKDAAQKTDKTFVSAHFSECTFMPSRRTSLTAFLKICQHEVYGKALRKITFCVQELRPDAVAPLHFLPRDEWKLWATVFPEVEREGIWPLLVDQMELRETEQDRALLRQAFFALKKYDNVLEVNVLAVGAEQLTRPRGMEFYRTWAGAKVLTFRDSIHCWQVVAAAIVASEVRVEHLDMGSHGAWTLELEPFFQSDSCLRDTTAIFGQLRSLVLAVNLHAEEYSEIEQAAQLLCAAKNVTHLTLQDRMSPFTIMSLQSMLAASEAFPALRYLRVERSLLLLEQCVKFIRGFPSLEKVVLSECEFALVENVEGYERRSYDGAGSFLKRMTGLANIVLKDCHTILELEPGLEERSESEEDHAVDDNEEAAPSYGVNMDWVRRKCT